VNTAVTRAEPTDPKTDTKASGVLRDDRVMLTVRTAADAEVALDIVRQDAPACVVTDPPIDS
jgi:hypothetical protein